MTDPELLAVGETRPIDGPGFQVSLERHRDSVWLLRRGSIEPGSLMAVLTRLDGDAWLVEPSAGAGAGRRFDTAEAALRFGVTR